MLGIGVVVRSPAAAIVQREHPAAVGERRGEGYEVIDVA